MIGSRLNLYVYFYFSFAFVFFFSSFDQWVSICSDSSFLIHWLFFNINQHALNTQIEDFPFKFHKNAVKIPIRSPRRTEQNTKPISLIKANFYPVRCDNDSYRLIWIHLWYGFMNEQTNLTFIWFAWQLKSQLFACFTCKVKFDVKWEIFVVLYLFGDGFLHFDLHMRVTIKVQGLFRTKRIWSAECGKLHGHLVSNPVKCKHELHLVRNKSFHIVPK